MDNSQNNIKDILMNILFYRFKYYISFGLFCVSLLACSKSAPSVGVVDNQSTITFSNPTYTPIIITFNNQTLTIPSGSSVTYSSSAGTIGTGTASTSGVTNSGTQVGELLTWNLDYPFPAPQANSTVALNEGSTYFFLKIINNASVPMTGIYVNYGYNNQTFDNVTVPNNGIVTSVGYYYAFTNSNVRATSAIGTYWYWPNLNLPFLNNQLSIVTGN
jgi:hypothetical protein